MKSVFMFAATSLAVTVLIACSSAPTETEVAQQEFYRYPSSISNRSVEPRFCAAISAYSTKLAKSNRGINMNECQHLISSNIPVCERFSFCDAKGAGKSALAQNRARVNLLVSTLNEAFAGVGGRIHELSNFHYRSSMRDPSAHIGFQDLVQVVSTDSQQAAR